jgi:hypothetical protein
MANAPHMGNAKITFKNNINASTNDVPIEYQASAWITFNNGWDDAANRPYPLTDQQEMVVEQLYQQLIQSGAQLQLTIKQKAGQDSRAWPIAGRMNLFVNKPKQDNSYQQQSYQQPQGGNSEW